MTEPNNRISSLGNGSAATPAQVDRRQGDGEFEKLLRQQYAQQQVRQAQQQPFAAPLASPVAPPPVSFSKHALQRLDKRQIELAPEQSQRLGNAVQAAANKGARQSLVIMDGIAFVVNVSDRTVVTAVNVGSGAGGSNPVFTNIDSAVVA